MVWNKYHYITQFRNGNKRIDKIITLQVAERSSFVGALPFESKHLGSVDFKLHLVEDDPHTHLEF